MKPIKLLKSWKNKYLDMLKKQKGYSKPRSCSLFLTDRCNFKCPGCSRSIIGVKKSKEMKLPTVKKLLEIYPSIKHFSLAGLGEPTLCADLKKIIAFLKEDKNRFVSLITNGSNTPQLLNLNRNIDQITISLNGFDNKSYKSNTGVAAYNRVIKTYKIIKPIFKNVGFSYILRRDNYKDLDEVLPLCDKLQPDFLYLLNYLVYDPKIKSEIKKVIRIQDTKIIRYIKDTSSIRDYIKMNPIYVDFKNPKYSCSSYNFKINLDGNGNIGGCRRQIPPNKSFGNIYRDKDPFNTVRMQELRKKQKNEGKPHAECEFCFGNWE